MDRSAEYNIFYTAMYNALLRGSVKLANTFNSNLTEERKQELRSEEQANPEHKETDSVIWSQELRMFIPNLNHIQREASMSAGRKLLGASR